MQFLKFIGTVTLLLLLIQPNVSAKGWALLVGVNDYEYPEIRDLRGCETDEQYVATVLRYRYVLNDEDMKILLSRDATRNGIITTFKEWLIEKPKPDDVVVFFFSGHGSQVVDENGDEADGWDELICPADLKPTSDRRRYLNPILDDDLNALLNQIPTDNVTVILDSCHSGTGTKSLIDAGLTLPKMIPRDLMLVPQNPNKPPITRQGESIAVEQTNDKHILISASSAEQVSLDAMWDASASEPPFYYAGVLTKNLVEVLRQATAETRFTDLIKDLRQSVRERSYQVPQLEGNADRQIFGMLDVEASYVVPPAKPFILVKHAEGNQVTLDAGSILGVTPGSIYDIFSPTEASFAGESLATAQITSVDLHQSAGKLLKSRVTIQPMCRAVESSHAHLPDKLYLQIRFNGENAPLASLKEAFLKVPDLVVADESARYADLVLEVNAQGSSFIGILTSIDGTELGKATASSAAQLAEALKPNLENAKVKKWLINLKNPNPPFKIDVWMDKGEHPVYQVGDVATFQFKSERDCYLTLLDVDTKGNITMLFPNQYHPDNRIVANTTYTIPTADMGFRIRAQAPPGRELIKAIATTDPIKIPEFDLNKTKEIFLDVGGADEVRNLTRGLGRSFVVERAEQQPEAAQATGVTHLPTSKFVTSEFIAEIKQ